MSDCQYTTLHTLKKIIHRKKTMLKELGRYNKTVLSLINYLFQTTLHILYSRQLFPLLLYPFIHPYFSLVIGAEFKEFQQRISSVASQHCLSQVCSKAHHATLATAD